MLPQFYSVRDTFGNFLVHANALFIDGNDGIENRLLLVLQ